MDRAFTEPPPEKAGEDPEQDVKMGIVVDPDKDNPMYVAVQAQVKDNKMKVHAKAVTEGEGKAEVGGEIKKGTAKDKDKIVLVLGGDNTDKAEMNLKAQKIQVQEEE